MRKAYIFRMSFAATKGHCIGAAEGISAVDKIVLATVNAPFKREIGAVTLGECIAQAEPNEWSVHVAAFFTDVSPQLIFGFAASHGISNAKLTDAYLSVKSSTGESNPDLE